MVDMEIEALIENFSLFEDWEEKYAYLIDLGKKLPSMDEALKNEETKVRGCTSSVWIAFSDAPMHMQSAVTFQADSDAVIVRGLVYVLMVIYAGKSWEQVQEIDVEMIFKNLGLESHLSPSRRNGFFSMVDVIRKKASAL